MTLSDPSGEEIISAGASEAGVSAVTQRGAVVSLGFITKTTDEGQAMLSKRQERTIVHLMKSDPPVAWPPLDSLAEEYQSTAKAEFGVAVDLADARVVVARHFRD